MATVMVVVIAHPTGVEATTIRTILAFPTTTTPRRTTPVEATIPHLIMTETIMPRHTSEEAVMAGTNIPRATGRVTAISEVTTTRPGTLAVIS